ncbi:MAG: hypothetical protein ACOZFS_03780 [Thermodesulfobacteriota bacterium]
MKASLARRNGINFWFNWTWNQWLGGLFLIFLGCLNLIWPVPILVLVVSLLVVLCFLMWPYAALVAATFLIGFDGITIAYFYKLFGYGYGICYFMAVFGLLCWCTARLAKITPPYQSTTLDLPLAIFAISCVIAVLWSAFPQDGVHVAIYTTMGYCLYLLISALNYKPQHLERLFWLWFLLGILTVLTTFSTFFFALIKSYHIYDQLYFRIYITQFDGTRVTLNGTMGAGAKAIAALLDVSILCGLTLYCTQVRRNLRLLILAGILIMLFVHFMTLTRLETMCLFLGWLTFVHLNPQWRNHRIRPHLWAAASVLVIFVALLVMFNLLAGASELFARALGQEQTVGYRFSGWQNRWDHIVVAVQGIWNTAGLGAGTRGIMREMDPSAWIDSPSLYFSVLTDHGYGILSLMLMGWIMINLFAELRWAWLKCPDPRYKIFILGVFSCLVNFGNPFGDQFFYIYHMWIMLGFSVTAVKGVRYLIKSSP